MRRFVLALLAMVVLATPAEAATLPSGFAESTAFSGLVNPTAVRFASDGRIFVAEKRGTIRVFDSLTDTTPTLFADLRTQVHNFWDRGLLGMALDPGFPANPYVYVLYTYDGAIGGAAPRWGTVNTDADPCPTPPGPTDDGCVVSGRLSRLQAAGNVMTGQEQVLINDWCQQYPSHSIGSLAFGPDGALYASGGDGASFNFADYGQDGSPLNPCGDPPGGAGAVLTPPTAEGGALRAQDVRSTGDPTGLDGTVIRVNPNTGAAMADNPNAGATDANARRIIAHGFRNPFRMTVRPGTSEVWLGDVGWNTWEEIDRIASPTASVRNFGWPCYEGAGRQPGYDGLNLNLCESLYAAGGVDAPFFTYNHAATVVPGETCATGSSATAGVAFVPPGNTVYPSSYAGAMFFTDYTRDCIWVMRSGGGGTPDPATTATFVAGAANPVELQFGPDGRLYYADFDGGTIKRIDYTAANNPPKAAATANPTRVAVGGTVAFDGSGSSDPDAGDTISYAWDLDGDGAYDDSSAVSPSWTYNSAGTFTTGLRVTDNHGASATAAVVVNVGNTAPTATIQSPAVGTTWAVGSVINFAGSATDPEDGPLAASRLHWDIVLIHCAVSNPSDCHSHVITSRDGVASGSFTAPDHSYPSYLELRLTATDSTGTTSPVRTLRLDPRTVQISLSTAPAGMTLTLNSETGTSLVRTVIEGSSNTVSAPSPQQRGRDTYLFRSWSDGGAQTHQISPRASVALSAKFTKR